MSTAPTILLAAQCRAGRALIERPAERLKLSRTQLRALSRWEGEVGALSEQDI